MPHAHTKSRSAKSQAAKIGRATANQDSHMSDQGLIFEQLMRPQVEMMAGEDSQSEPENYLEHPVSDEPVDGEELV